MDTKYGDYPVVQLQDYKRVLHNTVHKLLRFKEEHYPYLNRYFVAVLWQFNGLNEILNCPSEMITIVSLLESARIEALKPDCDFKLYRKAILDTHSLIDQLHFQAEEGMHE